MKLTKIIRTVFYLAPQAAVLAYVVDVGEPTWLMLATAVLRILFVSIFTFVIGLAIVEKVAFFQKDGLQFHIRFYPVYLVVFFVSLFLVGAELNAPQEGQIGRYTY